MTDDAFYDRALGRIRASIFALSAAGVIGAGVWRGWTWAAGFALGAAASWLNFRWLRQIVDALGGARPTRKRVAVLAGLRYALLGGGAYVILRYSPVSLTAALAGLFVAVAAVIIEICLELVYARSD
jgi:ATP synthase I chain